MGAGAPPQDALGVKVDVTRTPHTYFLGVIGQASWTINTTATAVSGRSQDAPSGELLPIAMWKLSDYKTGTIYALTNGQDAPGNFGWLAWRSTKDANALADSICTPDNPSFSVGSYLSADPGATNSVGVRNCLTSWVQSKKPVLIPIVDKVTGTGAKATYHVVGIAAFVDYRLFPARGRPDQRPVRRYPSDLTRGYGSGGPLVRP